MKKVEAEHTDNLITTCHSFKISEKDVLPSVGIIVNERERWIRNLIISAKINGEISL